MQGGVSDTQLSRLAQEIARSYAATETTRAAEAAAAAERTERAAEQRRRAQRKKQQEAEWEKEQEAEKQRRERKKSAVKSVGCTMLVPAFLVISFSTQVNLWTFPGLLFVLVLVLVLARSGTDRK